MLIDQQKILIVDDYQSILLLLEETLINEGYTVQTATNGTAALNIFEKHDINLVLLDMKLPGECGIDILKQMKHIRADVHVIMITAYSELDLVDQAYKYGADDLLKKPFDIEDMLYMVRHICEQDSISSIKQNVSEQ